MLAECSGAYEAVIGATADTVCNPLRRDRLGTRQIHDLIMPSRATPCRVVNAPTPK
jgi:hypothetical protein